jgi:hypothetical protein
MLPFVAATITIACIVASARALVFALTATSLDPRVLLATLRGDRDEARARLDALRIAVTDGANESWERDLIVALNEPKETRAAYVNEQLGEVDFRLRRWARVPRVCASIATSSGFLLASLALRNGLATASDLPDDVRERIVHTSIGDAINVAAIGLCGAAFCIAFQSRARSEAKARLTAIDKLVERIETLASGEPESVVASSE